MSEPEKPAHDEPSPNPGECCCCGFKTQQLFLTELPGRWLANRQTDNSTHWHCELCLSTLAGNACEELSDFAKLSAHINLVANLCSGGELITEARAQRDWLIKECERVGVRVTVRIGAPITEAYSLVNTAGRERDEAKKDAESWEHQWRMYRDAWVRELGGWTIPKSHEIDSLVLTTRKRCVNPLLGHCITPHRLGAPTADKKALQQTAHPREGSCREWAVDTSESNPRAESAEASVDALAGLLTMAMGVIEPLVETESELQPEWNKGAAEFLTALRSHLEDAK